MRKVIPLQAAGMSDTETLKSIREGLGKKLSALALLNFHQESAVRERQLLAYHHRLIVPRIFRSSKGSHVDVPVACKL